MKNPAGPGSKAYWEVQVQGSLGGGAAQTPPAVRPLIYIYELPPAFIAWGITVRGTEGEQGDFGRPIGYDGRIRRERPRVSEFCFFRRFVWCFGCFGLMIARFVTELGWEEFG